MNIPDGTVDKAIEDPTSNVNLPNGDHRSALAYDWQFKRWLPVPSRWVAPDGARYAYTDSQARVHLVGVSDGSDQIVASGASWGLYSFAADGIYAGQRDPSKQPSLLGLWRIPATGGTPQQLASQGTWLVVVSGTAWSVVQEGTPPTGATILENSFGSVLMRLDLQTGQTATWYTSLGGRFRVATVDSLGLPVLVGVDAPRIWVVTSAGVARTVNASTIFDVMADSHGVWYEDPMAISTYLVEGSAARRMGQYGYGGNFTFAGPCQ